MNTVPLSTRQKGAPWFSRGVFGLCITAKVDKNQGDNYYGTEHNRA